VGALTDYTTSTQNLLHDSTFRFWSQTQLTLFINQARNKVAGDTLCLRQLMTTINLPQGQEQFPVQATAATASNYPAGSTVVQVMGITVYWNTLRVKLYDWSFTKLDAFLRSLQNYQQTPFAFARIGVLNVFIAPIPQQAYNSDWECAITPLPLTSDATVDQLVQPYTEAVPYYAAYKAKIYQQSLGEAEYFMRLYKREVLVANRTWLTRAIPNPYAVDGD
jgi:hypothetical protein